MANCEYCGTENQTAGACNVCGKGCYTGGATFIFGKTAKDSYGCYFQLTDKYVVVRKVSKKEMLSDTATAAAFGLMGAKLVRKIDAARKKEYGFYDLQDVSKVIHPYNAPGLKKNYSFKFVNKDGSDFIIEIDLNGVFCGKFSKLFKNAIEQLGLTVENGDDVKHAVCCENPFVNEQTFGQYVSASAAAFPSLQTSPVTAPPAEAPAPQPVVQTPPAPQPAPQTPAAPTPQPAPRPTYQAPPAFRQAPTLQAPQSPPVQPKPFTFCTNCGTKNPSHFRFCTNCGTPLQRKF